VIAILLHCFFLSTFAWLFVQGLHIYRMQTEARNVNFGAMRFYYAIGWGVPAIITGRSCLSHGRAKNTSSQRPPEPLVSLWSGVRPQPAIWVVCVVLQEGVQVVRGGEPCCPAENMYHRLLSCLLGTTDPSVCVCTAPPIGMEHLLGLELSSPFFLQGWLLAWILRATGTLTSAGFPFMISWSGVLQAPLLSSLW